MVKEITITKTFWFAMLALVGFVITFSGVAGIAFLASFGVLLTPFSAMIIIGLGMVFWALVFSVMDFLIS